MVVTPELFYAAVGMTFLITQVCQQSRAADYAAFYSLLPLVALPSDTRDDAP